MKKKIIVSIIAVMIISFAALSIYGFYTKSIGGYKQVLSVSDFKFEMNDKVYSDNTTEIASTKALERGSSLSYDIKVSTDSKGTGSIKYQIAITNYSDTNNGVDVSRAIEVYKKIDGKTSYVGMLNELVCDSSTITGKTPEKNVISGFLGPVDSKSFEVIFLYSLSAGESYDNNSFSFSFEATPEVEQDRERYYVSTSQELISALRLASSQGRTVVLNSDVNLSNIKDGVNEDVILNGKVGLDLNGHNLTLSSNIIINLDSYNDNYDLFIGNSKNDGEILGSSLIKINASNDNLLPIDNKLQNTDKIIYINGYTNEALKRFLAYKLDKYNESLYTTDLVIDLSENIKYFLRDSFSVFISPTNPSFEEIEDGSLKYQTKLAFVPQNHVDSFEIYISNSETYIIKNFRFRGNGIESIIEYYSSLIPQNIEGSIYFPSYDQVTGARLNFTTSNEELLDDNGVFIKNGTDKMTNQDIRIALVVEYNGNILRTRLERTVIITSPLERFNSIFNFHQFVANNIDDVINFEDYLNNDKLQNAGYSSFSVLIDSATNTKDESTYLSNDNEIIKVNMLPANGTITKVSISITVNFLHDNGNRDSYLYESEVILIGLQNNNERVDPTSDLQPQFTNSSLSIENGEYYFYVNGFTKQGNLVKYELKDEFKDYILVEENKEIPSEDGAFIKHNDINYFINSFDKFKLDGDAYISALEDFTHIGVLNENGEYEYIPVLDRFDIKTLVLVDKLNSPSFDSTAYVDAYILNSQGEIIEVDSKPLKYEISIPLPGFLRNRDSEIKESSLYMKLLDVFDENRDGFITRKEASKEIDSLYLNKISSGNDGIVQELTSLKGLEYFTNVKKLYLQNQKNISDISVIRSFYKLEELNISGLSLLTNIKPLEFLDNLKVLTANNCKISDIEPLRYLPSLTTLNLANNTGITSLEALSSNLSTLRYLNMTGISSLSADDFYLKLTLANNSLLPNVMLSSGNVVASQAEKAAVIALTKLVEISETNNTLYLPNNVFYDGVIYSIGWQSNLTSTLKIVNDLDSNNNPIQVKSYYFEPMPEGVESELIDLKIYIKDPQTGTAVNFVRSFTIRRGISAGESSNPGLNTTIETSPGVIESATLYIKDETLLEALLKQFDTDKNNHISYEERMAYVGSQWYSNTYDLSNLGIGSINGIEFFPNIHKINLNGNVLESLAPLKGLTGLEELYLNTGSYDFSEISFVSHSYYNEEGELTVESSGVKTLTTLIISGVSGLDSDEVNESLYQVYLANPNVSIYSLGEWNEWNPYSNVESRLSSYLPSTYTLKGNRVHLFKDESGALAKNAVEVDGNYFFEFMIYDKYPIRVNSSANASFYSFANTNNSNPYKKYLSLDSSDNNYIYVSGLYVVDAIHYMTKTYNIRDTHISTNTLTQLATIYSIFDDEIKISYDDNGQSYTNVPLREVFPGYDILEYVLYVYMNKKPNFYTFTKEEKVITLAEINTFNSDYYYNDKKYSARELEIRGLYYSDGSNKNNTFKNLHLLNKINKLWIDQTTYIEDAIEFKYITSLNFKKNYIDLSKLNGEVTSITTVSSDSQNYGSNLYDPTFEVRKDALLELYLEQEKTSYLNEILDYIYGSSEALATYELVNRISAKYYEVFRDSTNKETDTNLLEISRLLSKLGAIKDSNDRYVFYLRNLPNVAVLNLDKTATKDYRGLVGLVGLGHLRSLTTKTNTSSNDNTYVETSFVLYSALYYDYKRSSGNTPDYRVGRFDNLNSNDQFDPSNVTPIENAWNAIFDLKPIDSIEYNNFKDYILDLGLKVNLTSNQNGSKNSGIYHHNLLNEKLNMDSDTNYLFLPKYSEFFKTTGFDSEGNETEFMRCFEISWYYAGNGNSNTLFDLFGINATDRVLSNNGAYETKYLLNEKMEQYYNASDRGYYLPIKDLGYDFYFYLVGRIGEGLGTVKEFSYPLLLTKSDRVYSTNAVIHGGGSSPLELFSVTDEKEYFFEFTANSDASRIYNAYGINSKLAYYASYRSIKDLALRFAMFNALSRMSQNSGASDFNYSRASLPGAIYVNYKNRSDISSITDKEAIGSILLIHQMKITNDNGYIYIDTQRYNKTSAGAGAAGIVSAFSNKTASYKGLAQNIDFFTYIIDSSFFVNNQYVNSIDFLAERRNMLEADFKNFQVWQGQGIWAPSDGYKLVFDFDDNLITSAGAIASYSKLNRVELSNNAINDLSSSDWNIMHTSINEFKLDGNYHITADKLKDLKGGNFSKIQLQNTFVSTGASSNILDDSRSGLIFSIREIMLANNNQATITINSNGSDKTYTLQELNAIATKLSDVTNDFRTFLTNTNGNTPANGEYAPVSDNLWKVTILNRPQASYNLGLVNLNIKVVYNGKYEFYTSAPFNLGGINYALVVYYGNNASLLNVNDCNPYIFNYLLTGSTKTEPSNAATLKQTLGIESFSSGTSFRELVNGDLNLGTSTSLTSLKGVEKLNWITKLQITPTDGEKNKISELGFDALAINFPNLTHLKIAHTGLSEEDIYNLINRSPKLQGINFFNQLALDYYKVLDPTKVGEEGATLAKVISNKATLNSINIDTSASYFNTYGNDDDYIINSINNNLGFYDPNALLFNQGVKKLKDLSKYDSYFVMTAQLHNRKVDFRQSYSLTTKLLLDSSVNNKNIYGKNYKYDSGNINNKEYFAAITVSKPFNGNPRYYYFLTTTAQYANSGTVTPHNGVSTYTLYYRDIRDNPDFTFDLYLPTRTTYWENTYVVNYTGDPLKIFRVASSSNYMHIRVNKEIFDNNIANMPAVGTTKEFSFRATMTKLGSTAQFEAANIIIRIVREDNEFKFEEEVEGRDLFFIQAYENGEYLNAFDVFESQYFVKHLFTNSTATIKGYNGTTQFNLKDKIVTVTEANKALYNLPLGSKVISHEWINKSTIITLGDSFNISTLKGFEIFNNIKELYLANNIMIKDLSVVANWQLTHFQSYANYAISNVHSMYLPNMDFDYLLNSRETLTYFFYGTKNSASSSGITSNLITISPDFSFLLDMPRLNNITIGSTSADAIYYNSESFKYVFTNLYNSSRIINLVVNGKTYKTATSWVTPTNPFARIDDNNPAYLKTENVFAAKVLDNYLAYAPIGVNSDFIIRSNGGSFNYILSKNSSGNKLASFIIYDGAKYTVTYEGALGASVAYDMALDSYTLDVDTTKPYSYLYVKINYNGFIYSRCLRVDNQSFN